MRQQRMDAAMNAPGGLVRCIGALHGLLVVGIEQHEIGRLDAGEMPPARIHQELLAVGRYGEAEVIGDRLVPVEMLGEPEGRGEVDPQLALMVLTAWSSSSIGSLRSWVSSG